MASSPVQINQPKILKVNKDQIQEVITFSKPGKANIDLSQKAVSNPKTV